MQQNGFGTRAIHVGQSPLQWTSGALIPPICLSTTFYQTSPGQPLLGFDYSRADNPTRQCLEQCLASLESAKHGLTFSSGLATTMTIIQTLVKSGEHVVCVDDCYGGTGRYFRKCVSQLGVETTFVDGREVENFINAVIPNKTRIVWIETPTNPTLRLSDIAGVVKSVKKLDPEIYIVVDNTFMSSYLQQPLQMGADIVMHSLTKYMNGHSDVIMGAMMTNNGEVFEKLKFFQKSLGAVPSSFDCFLVNRGLKTLHLRMEAHSKNGMAIATFLEGHPQVRKVSYPGLASHPQHELARKQCPRGFGGMVTFHLKLMDIEITKKFLQNLKLFMLAESLGGVESLVEVPALMTHSSHPPELLKQLEIDVSLIRVSCGVEDQKDLIEDLEQALSVIN